jgi:hypothetical protein
VEVNIYGKVHIMETLLERNTFSNCGSLRIGDLYIKHAPILQRIKEEQTTRRSYCEDRNNAR